MSNKKHKHSSNGSSRSDGRPDRAIHQTRHGRQSRRRSLGSSSPKTYKRSALETWFKLVAPLNVQLGNRTSPRQFGRSDCWWLVANIGDVISLMFFAEIGPSEDGKAALATNPSVQFDFEIEQRCGIFRAPDSEEELRATFEVSKKSQTAGRKAAEVFLETLQEEGSLAHAVEAALSQLTPSAV